MWDEIIEFLDKIGPLFYVIIPGIWGIYFKIKEKLKEKERDILKEKKAKALAKYKVWEHEESQKIIKRIKDLCNYYKDKGHMDAVHYLQLENGTVATSKLCNMFMSCLAEDSRYGTIPKMISKLQRVPYSKLAYWVEAIRTCKENDEEAVIISDVNKSECNIAEMVVESGVKSIISAPIYDPNELLLGMCVFYYGSTNLNNQPNDAAIDLIRKFRASIESVFTEYHMNRGKKREELGLKEEDIC